MSALTIAFALYGVILGGIYVLFGWKTPSQDVPLHRNPPLVNLTLFVTGAMASALLEFFNIAPDDPLFITYLVALLATVLAMAIVAVPCLTFLWWLSEFHGELPFRRIVSGTLGAYFASALHGVGSIREDLQEQRRALDESEAKRLRGQLERANRLVLELQHFWMSVHRTLLEKRLAGRTGWDELRGYLEVLLRLLLLEFFEAGKHLSKFRAAYYHAEPEAGRLRYIRGVCPPERAFSEQPLHIDRSLAGVAFRTGETKYFPDNREEGFETRGSRAGYEAFVVVPVPYRQLGPGKAGVLVVDCTELEHPFKQKLGHLLLTSFADSIYDAILTLELPTP